MAKLARRCSLQKFIIYLGLFWLILLVYFYSSTNSDDSEFSDTSSPTQARVHQVRLHDYIDPRLELAKDVKTTRKKSTKRTEPFVWPVLSDEIKELHKMLNLSNPGHMGQPVNLPPNLPDDIAQKISKSWEVYSINEFVSTLIPLDRDLPDIRPEYCRTVSYVDNLPMVSVIMVFHNEPLSMILRSVFAVFKRTSEKLLKEIVLVDDCSTHGEELV